VAFVEAEVDLRTGRGHGAVVQHGACPLGSGLYRASAGAVADARSSKAMRSLAGRDGW
jgi:hypothetical protein